MPLPSIYDASVNASLCKRIDALTRQSQRLWGKMTVSQMLKHLAVPYNDLLVNTSSKSPLRILGILFMKSTLTNEKPFRKNAPTAKNFIIKEEPDFEYSKNDLKSKMLNIHNRGKEYFEGKEHPLLGKLTAVQWNNMLYKHLDHHLRQFGV